MSKAEDRALEKYPKKIEWVGNQWDGAPFDVNSKSRVAYKQGYEQAEKDFELSWEDMFSIFSLVNEVLDDYAEGKTKKEVGEEVLKRFKDYKERKEK
jgi:hypothetical protein